MTIENRPTRGKTHPGRLRFVDRWIQDAISTNPTPQLVVDLGPGEHAWTTLELADTVGVAASVYAVENDVRRCENLRAEAGGRFQTLNAGFDLGGLENIGLLRAMNVFRQYPPDKAQDGYSLLANKLTSTGRLLVGSCDKKGDIGTFWVLGPSATGAKRLALVAWTTGERGFAPIQLRDYLPRDLRRDGSPSNPFWSLESAWTEIWETCRGGLSAREAFDASVGELRSVNGARLVSSGLAEFPFCEGGFV